MATYPTVAIGQRLTANFLTSFLPQTARKTATTTRTSTVTTSADPELTLPVEASASYELQFMLKYDAAGVIASGAGGIRWVWTVPVGTTGDYGVADLSINGTGVTGDEMRGVSLTTVTGANGANAAALVAVIGTGTFSTSTTAGSVVLSWAQWISSATATNLQANSYMKLTRIG